MTHNYEQKEQTSSYIVQRVKAHMIFITFVQLLWISGLKIFGLTLNMILFFKRTQIITE